MSSDPRDWTSPQLRAHDLSVYAERAKKAELRWYKINREVALAEHEVLSQQMLPEVADAVSQWLAKHMRYAQGLNSLCMLMDNLAPPQPRVYIQHEVPGAPDLHLWRDAHLLHASTTPMNAIKNYWPSYGPLGVMARQLIDQPCYALAWVGWGQDPTPTFFRKARGSVLQPRPRPRPGIPALRALWRHTIATWWRERAPQPLWREWYWHCDLSMTDYEALHTELLDYLSPVRALWTADLPAILTRCFVTPKHLRSVPPSLRPTAFTQTQASYASTAMYHREFNTVEPVGLPEYDAVKIKLAKKLRAYARRALHPTVRDQVGQWLADHPARHPYIKWLSRTTNGLSPPSIAHTVVDGVHSPYCAHSFTSPRLPRQEAGINRYMAQNLIDGWAQALNDARALWRSDLLRLVIGSPETYSTDAGARLISEVWDDEMHKHWPALVLTMLRTAFGDAPTDSANILPGAPAA